MQDNNKFLAGNSIFPLIKIIKLSEEERVLILTYSTTNKPIKVKIYLDGVKLFTSSFIGNITNQTELNIYNLDNNLSLEDITDVLTQNVTINKATTNRELKIEIYAPLLGNIFTVTNTCEI